MKPIYLFGWTGYVGSHVMRRLVSDGFEVITVGRSPLSNVNIDLSSSISTFPEVFENGAIFIFLAANSSPDVLPDSKSEYLLINYFNTIALCQQLIARNIKVLFSSSDAVYGESSVALTESSPCNPTGLYGELKYKVESYFSSCQNFKSFRLSYVFSSVDKYTKYLTNSFKDNCVPEVYKGFERSIVSLNDVCDGIERIIRNYDSVSSVINFSGPALLSRVEMANVILEHHAGSSFVTIDPPDEFFKNRPKTINTDCGRFCSLLGREPDSYRDYINDFFRGGVV